MRNRFAYDGIIGIILRFLFGKAFCGGDGILSSNKVFGFIVAAVGLVIAVRAEADPLNLVYAGVALMMGRHAVERFTYKPEKKDES